MRKVRKLLALALAVCMLCSLGTTALAVEENAPVSRPREDREGYYLEDSQTRTYDENGYTVVETYEVYRPIVQSRSGDQEVTHVVTKTKPGPKPNYTTYFVYRLDADFIYNTENNTVECPRYYSSYSEVHPSIDVEPYESDMEYKTGSTNGTSYFKLRAQTTFSRSIDGSESFWNAIGCDAKGKKLTSY